MKKKVLVTAPSTALASMIAKLALQMPGRAIAKVGLLDDIGFAPPSTGGCPKLTGRRLVNTLKCCPPKRYRGAA